ncbi:hypothetical protein [Mycobacterium sp. DL592]|uniref:hypothetical protein n=1 Tax=Mycobacterium sp. DL592 TaxID=2675524 RepID=UPI001AAFAF9C|nr:hypothetical protein [Mycobacterium sp. DL592]
MAEHSAAVSLSEPPGVVMRVMNPVLKFVLGTPAGGALKQFMVLRFSGRKSGRQYAVPVSAHLIGGDLYALANATWKLNFRGGGPAQVAYGGKTKAMRGELIEDPATVAELFHRCAVEYGPKKAELMMGLKFSGSQVPTLEEFRAAVVDNKLVGIRFTAG